MDILTVVLLVSSGLIAGFINTIAGGGSLLTVPLLIFLGLPPVVANATNRVAIVIQNGFAIAGFRRKGISDIGYGLFLAVSATIGAIIGARFAVNTSGDAFKQILSIVMVLVLALILWNPFKKKGPVDPNLSLADDSANPVPVADHCERMAPRHKAIGLGVFFFVGLYGGFIQVGVGFIILAALTLVNSLGLVKANSIKVTVIFLYTLAAVAIFAWNGMINWQYGLLLSVGNAFGGWIGSHWAVSMGEKWIRRILVVAVLAMAFKLSGLWNLLVVF